jgi:hypothetical protein
MTHRNLSSADQMPLRKLILKYQQRCFTSHFSRTNTYPTTTIDCPWGVPVEISLIAQLSHGEGTSLFLKTKERQKAHMRFIDELDEPSSKIGATRLDKNDKTALYTFTVGCKGHPFHRHQGHRVVVAVSGSGGADLRFSPATLDEIELRPETFLDNLRTIRIPGDTLFTMRFDGRVWHQFAPTPCPTGAFQPLNPAFFAISVHTDETNGNFDDSLRDLITSDQATIASLTELLPTSFFEKINIDGALSTVPITTLSFASSPIQENICRFVRGAAGAIKNSRGVLVKDDGGSVRYTGAGFALTTHDNHSARTGSHFNVKEVPPGQLPAWLLNPLSDLLPSACHTDAFILNIPSFKEAGITGLCDADMCLARLLEGFVENSPPGVNSLQAIRNALVRPLGLRTSPLGCPVSSLLIESDTLFANKFPVRSIIRNNKALPYSPPQTSPPSNCVAVILGADDWHLKFRTLIGVDTLSGNVEIRIKEKIRD